MHIKTNARWFKIFQWPMRHPKPSFCANRGLPGSRGECWLLRIPGRRAWSFLRSGPGKPKTKRYKSKTAWAKREPGLSGVYTMYQAEGLYVSSLYFPTVHRISWPTPSTEGNIMSTKKEECLWRWLREGSPFLISVLLHLEQGGVGASRSSGCTSQSPGTSLLFHSSFFSPFWELFTLKLFPSPLPCLYGSFLLRGKI